MVHGNALRGYYGILVAKDQYEKLSEELPMKYAELFTEVREGRRLIKIDLKRREDAYPRSMINMNLHPGGSFISFGGPQLGLLGERDVGSLAPDADDKIKMLEKKITSYRGDWYAYMGLHQMALSDIEKQYDVDLPKLQSELETMIAPFKKLLGVDEHSFCFYVYAFSY